MIKDVLTNCRDWLMACESKELAATRLLQN